MMVARAAGSCREGIGTDLIEEGGGWVRSDVSIGQAAGEY